MWNTIPEKKTIDATLQALQKNGFNPVFAESEEEAKDIILATVPSGAEVFTVTSKTLEALNVLDALNTSGAYNAVRPKLMHMDRKTQGREMQKLGAAPDVVLGSVHAVTEDGHVLIASRTGSQLAPYVYGAGKVVWVVGAQKIVKNTEEGMKRIFEHCLPLESERANKAYNITTGSRVNKVLTYFAEEMPQRITLILVNKVLGF